MTQHVARFPISFSSTTLCDDNNNRYDTSRTRVCRDAYYIIRPVRVEEAAARSVVGSRRSAGRTFSPHVRRHVVFGISYGRPAIAIYIDELTSRRVRAPADRFNIILDTFCTSNCLRARPIITLVRLSYVRSVYGQFRANILETTFRPERRRRR